MALFNGVNIKKEVKVENKKSNKTIFKVVFYSAISFILCLILISFVKNSDSLQLITLSPYLTVSLCSAIACVCALLTGIIIGIIFSSKKWGIFLSIAVGIAAGALMGNFCSNIITNGENIGIKINFFILLCAMFGGITGGVFGTFLFKISNSAIFSIKSFNKKIVLINLFVWLLAVITVPFALDYNSYRTMAWAENLLQKAKINGETFEIATKSHKDCKKLADHLYYRSKSTMVNNKISVKKFHQKLSNGKKSICLKWEIPPKENCTLLILFSLNKSKEIKIPLKNYIAGG